MKYVFCGKNPQKRHVEVADESLNTVISKVSIESLSGKIFCHLDNGEIICRSNVTDGKEEIIH